MSLIKTPKAANYKFGGQADKPVRFHEYKSEITRFSYKGIVIERKGSRESANKYPTNKK